MARAGAFEASVRVHGAVDELVARTGEPVTGLERELRDDAHQAARGALGTPDADASVAAGRAAGIATITAEAVSWLEKFSAEDRTREREAQAGTANVDSP